MKIWILQINWVHKKMKLSKNFGKENYFYLLLLIGSFLVFTMFHSSHSHQALWLRKLTWSKIQQVKRHWNNLRVPTDADNHPEEWSDKNLTSGVMAGEINKEAMETKPICDFSDWRSDICNMTGDIRTQGSNISTVFFLPPPNTLIVKEQQWSVNAYSQKIYMYFSKNVTVKQLRSAQNAPLCTVDHSNTPAILVSLGGPTGNIWHDFTDVIIPLFLAARPLNRDVRFLIINYQQWFLDKFSFILKDLSRYEIVNFDEDKEVRCYRQMSVGLLNHKDLSIDPKRAFDGFNMFKFRMYIRSIYSLPMDEDIQYRVNQHTGKRPRLLLVVRSKSRRFLNQEEIADAIKKAGFELVEVEPKRSDNLSEISALVDSCDVLMGVHGAALTNILFLRTNALMLQVIPLGGKSMRKFATSCYDGPADEMKIRRIDYHITPEESSLFETYGMDDPILNDPDTINLKGWNYRQKYYWNEQNVRLNLTRFEPVLRKALELLRA